MIAAPTAGGSFFGQPPLTQPIPVVGEGLVPSRRKQASIPAKARQIRMRLRIRPAFLCDFRLPAGRPQGPPLRGWREIADRRGRRPLRGRRRGLFPSQSTGGRTRRLTAPPVGGAKWRALHFGKGAIAGEGAVAKWKFCSGLFFRPKGQRKPRDCGKPAAKLSVFAWQSQPWPSNQRQMLKRDSIIR